jgi:hypothetical protein
VTFLTIKEANGHTGGFAERYARARVGGSAGKYCGLHRLWELSRLEVQNPFRYLGCG